MILPSDAVLLDVAGTLVDSTPLSESTGTHGINALPGGIAVG